MGQNVLPFYLVCDGSGSMSGEPIDAINRALPELHHEIGTNPVVADKTRFAIIGFSNQAEVLLPLSDLSEVASLPVLSTKGSTSYAAALRCVRDEIELDVARLKGEGHQVFRPVVFFLTDGYPNPGEDWKSPYDELTSSAFAFHPNIVAFGIGEADKDVISSVATFRAFVADDSVSPAVALSEFAQALTKSIVRSGSTQSGDGGMVLQTPDEVPGFTSLSVDAL